MDSDEEDYVFFGTPIEREEEIASRKKKAVAEAAGQLRTLPSWKQEVRDEEGRRRFHGAFMGGYSAGYFNTVGSKEGWTPQSFVSSRKNRAEVKQQNILNFLDEDEKAELEGQSLGTSSQFDTFGFTAAELARKQAEKEQKQRPSAIPGPVPDDIVLPATESIGVKLLLKMGWRRGRSIKDSHADSLYSARREARKAFLAFSSDDGKAHAAPSGSIQGELENYTKQLANDDVSSSQDTHIYALTPKQDLHGLGFDPYKNAPEFRERKRSRVSGNRSSMKNNLFGFKSGKVAPGFGIGALEELDVEDEDVFASDYDFEETYVQEVDEPPVKLTVDSKQKLITNDRGILPGFRLASNADYQLERFDAPLVPKDFEPHHKFPGPLETDFKVADAGPPEVSPPEDSNLRLLIDGVATLVARCGKLFEDLSREKNQSNPLFSFLLGGNGHDYYTRKLWEARQKRADQTKHQLDGKVSSSMQKLTAESRGQLLGERPLERSFKDASSSVASSDSVQLQYNLSDTFTKPTSHSELPEVVPFKDDPTKQERFERFLKEKYQGGLRTTQFAGTSNMTEAARARERLDFEAAAEAIEKGKQGKESKVSTQSITNFLATAGMQFTSGGLQKAEDSNAEDSTTKKMYPKRDEFQWRPLPILCKRFDLIDPYMGKPPPAPRIRSKMDSLIFMPDSMKAKNIDETVINRDSLATPKSDAQGINKDVADKEVEVEVEVENVERPVDLYKAIFSDDSDDEEETTTTSLHKVEHPEKKVEAANTALSRLVAGDFLESLGKELGLEVPPEPPYLKNKTVAAASEKEVNENSRNDKIPSIKDSYGIPHNQEMSQDDRHKKNELIHGTSGKISRHSEIGSSEKKNDLVNSEKNHYEDRKVKIQHRSLSSSSSSEDDRSRSHSRRHQHRSNDSDSDPSSDHGRHQSRSKGKRKKYSREKSSSSRRHSKHHDCRSKDSPSRSRHDSEKEHAEAKREKHRRRS